MSVEDVPGESDRAVGSRHRPVLGAVAVVIAAAVGWVGLTAVTGGLAYVAPLALTVHLFGNSRVGVVVYVLAPVVVAVLVRRPWWVRWILVGVGVVDLTYVALAYLP